MRIFHFKKDLQTHLNTVNNRHKRIGLVPTMGALHFGHLALVRASLAQNELTIVSIFVNPVQFNKQEDLLKYPKTLERDNNLLQEISDQILIFNPAVSEMYPDGLSTNTYNFGGLEHVMEGEFRPGHFAGVATIVEAFLQLVQPKHAYFGEKDFQQLQIVKKLVALKKIPTTIVGCPIVREKHGLAMSSRNERLSMEVREKAKFIYQTLCLAREKFNLKSAKTVQNWVEKRFEKNPEFTLEYFTIRTVDTFKLVQRKHPSNSYRAFISVYAEGVRLIDNIAL